MLRLTIDGIAPVLRGGAMAVSIAVVAAVGVGCGEPDEASPASGAGAGASGAGAGGSTPPPDASLPSSDAGGQSPHADAAAPVMDASAPLDATLADATADATADDGGGPVLPETLAESGLYAPGSTSELAPGVMAYAPRYELWSDGAEKQRWLLLPAGTQIDTSDMDAWQFPVGTKLWKEFARDGKRLETRLVWNTDEGWFRMAFVCKDAESEAVAAPNGQDDVRDTEHDVPQRTACGECHDGQPDFVLGLSAIQLAHDGPGLTLAQLVADGLRSAPPTADLELPDTEEWNTLGYLHANCGSCHSPRSIVWDKVDLDLWLRASELASVADTRSYQSTVGVALTDTGGSLSLRIAPGDPAASGLVLRMNTRGDETAMPPLASERVDESGIALVSSFIEGL